MISATLIDELNGSSINVADIIRLSKHVLESFASDLQRTQLDICIAILI